MRKVTVELINPNLSRYQARVSGDLKKDTPEYVIVDSKEGRFKIPWARIHVLREDG